MKFKKKALYKGRELASLGLLVTGMGLSNIAWAGCESTLDPFMKGFLGSDVDVFTMLGHPCAQPHPGPSAQTRPGDVIVDDVITSFGDTTFVVTPEGQHIPQNPFDEPPGSNFLMTVYENMRDLSGREMPNTLPSTPENPYNLHDGDVLTRSINPINPEDDLDAIIDRIEKRAEQGHGSVPKALVRRAINILEGNHIGGRAYSGFPMLHYNGPSKVKAVEPIYDDEGVLVGGNVDVDMIYFNQHIESDTAFIDPSAVQEVPYTVTYHVKVLNRGIEDFSPMTMNFNNIIDPATGEDRRGPFHTSMDKSYFPMLDEGTEYTIKIKENKGKYFNLTYTWGWRIHPPRVQVMENALKMARESAEVGGRAMSLPNWEKDAFCEGGAEDTDCDPVNNAEDKAYAIAQIGDLSPAKRMWNTFKSLQEEGGDPCEGLHGWPKFFCYLQHWQYYAEHGYGHHNDQVDLAEVSSELRSAFLDWTDRTRLPTGVEADPDATITLFFVNNTIYGSRQGLSGENSGQGPASYKGIANGSAHDWVLRPYNYKVTLRNGDHFAHGYMNVDFGGSRGWENHFQFTDPITLVGPHPEVPAGHPAEEDPFNNPANVIANHDSVFPINRGGTEEFLQPNPRNLLDEDNGDPQLGSGCYFTFGRNHAWPAAGGPWGAISVPEVDEDGLPGSHKVDITFNYEPSTRLKIYQFDPLHHDVAIYSLH